MLVFADISRKQAFLTHLSVSLAVFLVMLYLMIFEWFPSFYYAFDNGYMGTAVIFFVDVVLGPGLTLLVFKPDKSVNKLKFDMAVIILFQLTALTWGVKSVYEDRPTVTVFYDGRFLAMTQTVSKDVDREKISKGKSGNQMLAYLGAPESFEEKTQFMIEAYKNKMSSEYYYGKLFVPIDENNVKKMAEYQLNMESLRAEDAANADAIEEYIKKHPGYLESYYLYPIRSRFNMGIAVFDPSMMRIIDILDIRTFYFAEKPEIDYEALKDSEKTIAD